MIFSVVLKLLHGTIYSMQYEIYINILCENQFARYYQVPSNDFRVGKAPVIELGYERNFHVEKIFLDEIEGMVCIKWM